MLPRAGGLGIAQHHRLARLKTAENIGDDPVGSKIPTANDIARPCTGQRNIARLEKAFAKRFHHNLTRGFRGGIGVVPAQRISFLKRATEPVIAVDLIGRHHENGAQTGDLARCLQHIYRAHDIGLEG